VTFVEIPDSMTPSRTASVSQFSLQLIQTRSRPTVAREILYQVFVIIIFEFTKNFD